MANTNPKYNNKVEDIQKETVKEVKTTSKAQKKSSKPTFKEYKVCVTAPNHLNMRTGAGMENPVLEVLQYKTEWTIVEEKNGWGHIKDKGWINLDFTKKID